MKIAAAQINTTIGDFDANAGKILDRLAWAEGAGVDLLIFPELAICGYPPRDLLKHSAFIDRAIAAVHQLAKRVGETGVLVGTVTRNEQPTGRPLMNSALLLYRGKIFFTQHKMLLPFYDVFDETRYFEPAAKQSVCGFKGRKLGISICEDLWSEYQFDGRQLYPHNPIDDLVRDGAEVIINISASPYSLGKERIREEIACTAAKRFSRPVLYCNLVGGNDELIFDGRSFFANAKGELVGQAAPFVEDSFIIDLDERRQAERTASLSDVENIRGALILGLRDYASKCGFSTAIIGLSGGIDSSVVATIAVEALGKKAVTGILMPSPFTAQRSLDDALELAKNLRITTETHCIDAMYADHLKQLSLSADAKKISVVHENIQARIRGTILMAISNKTGALVLSTGNKSELAVGFCTLYGDMAGGLAVISDLPKMMVYEVAKLINREQEIIPLQVLTRAPSAELRPDQKDEDTIPPYPVLDAILKLYIEERMSIAQIVREGFDVQLVADVTRRVDRNEYKRRQAAPGFKVTSKAFGIGRRFPIAWKS